jgi:hypothetical protein
MSGVNMEKTLPVRENKKSIISAFTGYPHPGLGEAKIGRSLHIPRSCRFSGYVQNFTGPDEVRTGIVYCSILRSVVK